MMGFGFGALGIVMMVIIWVGIIAVALLVLDYAFPRAPSSTSSSLVAGAPGPDQQAELPLAEPPQDQPAEEEPPDG